MKFALLLLVVAVTVSATAALNYTFGYVDYRYDRLLFSQDVYESSKFLRKAEAYVKYPAPGHIGHNITAIFVTNRNGKGATPKIKEGGVHYTYARIKLTSERGKSINATVSIYGKIFRK